jgi:hypothetical protein
VIKKNELKQDAALEIEMLRRKEEGDRLEREKNYQQKVKLLSTKSEVQAQMMERERLKEEAYQEYVREREQVDQIVSKMIQEDMEMMKLSKIKQEQSKQDMILSLNEKRALLRRQKELEEYEEEMVRRYAHEQQ